MHIWNDFASLVKDNRPLIDLRAPMEFERGSFRHASNLPLMSDEERHQVGICYKEKGNEAAIALGHELVSGAVKQQRVSQWLNFLRKHPDSLLFCFRGGQRSQIAQRWIVEAGGPLVPRLEGGYKAFRRYLLDCLEPGNIPSQPVILAGHTGAGKTIILKKFAQTVDLEALANHRGSAFGPQLSPQPTQIQFENDLAYRVIHHAAEKHRFMLLEDEGSHVGRCYLPKSLVEHFAQGDFIFLEVPLAERTTITMKEYVEDAQQQFTTAFGQTEGRQRWCDYIGGSIDRLKKRLGGLRHAQIRSLFDQAWDRQERIGDMMGHRAWIEMLLRDYYDPMYEYQMEKKKGQAVFFGDREAVIRFIQERYTSMFL